MQKSILSEIREIKTLLSKLIGTSDLPSTEQFSRQALDKVAKQFQKLSIERDEWIEESNICKYIKNADHRTGAFIRQEFVFSNYFKLGRTYYYNKKDLIALGKELKARNVDLGRYMEYRADQAKFKKYIETINQTNKGKKKRKSFDLPYDLKDITTSGVKAPSVDIINQDLARLKEEFFQYSLADYVDIYNGNHAMMKYIYHFEKYLEQELKKKCRRWCDNFNYANHALEMITKKKEVFIPVKEEDMIQL
jgi:hypothetical protein